MGKSIVITTGGGTDTSEGSPNTNTAYILSGYTIYDREGEKRTGSLVTKTLSKTLNPGDSVTIPAGYYTGANTNKVSAVALSSKTGATADPGHILKDKTGWRDGAKKIGTMVSVGTRNGTIGANGTFTIPVGWHKGDGKVTQSLSTQVATNVTPGTAQKTVIAASKWTTGAQTVLGNGNLVAGNIKNNVTIFGVKGSYGISGKVPWTVLWSARDQYHGPNGETTTAVCGKNGNVLYCNVQLDSWAGNYFWRQGRVSSFTFWILFDADVWSTVRINANIEANSGDAWAKTANTIEGWYYSKSQNKNVKVSRSGDYNDWQPTGSGIAENRWRRTLNNILFTVPNTSELKWDVRGNAGNDWRVSAYSYCIKFVITGSNFYFDPNWIGIYRR